MSRFCPLFSGSSGNSTYISSCKNGILIDAGASFKLLSEALYGAGGSFDELKAIAITHDHSDHIKGLKTFLKKTGLPVIASQETLDILIKKDCIPSEIKTVAMENETVDFGGFGLSRFDTSHDCNGSSGYTVEFENGEKVAVCTDTGIVTDGIRNAISGCGTVLLESNHDIDMLKRGPYPPELKLRILSDYGHLSNVACAAELSGLLNSGCTRFVLGHLSQHNNLPMLALTASKTMLKSVGATAGSDYTITVAKPSGNEVVLF